MIKMLPRIIRAVIKEHRWLKRLQQLHSWDVIVSDNRYGMFHPQVISVFITHQLYIRSGRAAWIDKILQSINFLFINRFDHCWIPDEPGLNNLAGDLCHGVLPSNARYIGPLSRFDPNPEKGKGDLLVLLSGPEPQRTLLEGIMAEQLRNHQVTATIVRGLPGDTDLPQPIDGVKWLNHLPASDLGKLMAASEVIVARSGYSTVMDLVRTGNKAILIPTPGQTEQIYLAAYLSLKGVFLSYPQEVFDLGKALAAAEGFPFNTMDISFNRHCEVISGLLSEEKKKNEN